MPAILATAQPVPAPIFPGLAPSSGAAAPPRKIDQKRLAGLFGPEASFYESLGTAADQIRSQLNGVSNPAAERQRIANTAFLADRLNLPAADVAARYDTLRNGFAQQVFADRTKDGVMDDGVFFTNASRLMADETEERARLGNINRVLFTAATEGKGFAEAFARAKATGEIPTAGPKADLFNGWALERWEANRERAARLAPVIETVATVMQAARDRTGTPDEARGRWDGAVDAMVGLDPEERSTVLALAVERTKGVEKGAERDGAAKAAGALLEGMSDFAASATLGLYNTAEAIVGHSAEERQRAERYQIEQSLDRAISGEIDPIEADSFAGQVALDFTRSLPTMLAALTPAGLVADYFALKQNARERLEAQGANGPAAEGVATLQAIPQTALFFVSSKMVFLGKAPGFTMPQNWTLAGLGESVAKVAGVEYAANFGLNQAGVLSDAGIQAIAAKLTEAVPGVDWREFGRAFKDSLPEQLAFAIPGALIGTGIATFKNLKQGQRYLRQLATAEELGFQPEAIEAIATAPDYATAEAAFREGWEARAPDILDDAEAELMAQRERERVLSAPDFDVSFEALGELAPHPDDLIVNPAAPDIPAQAEAPDVKLRSELAYVLKEIHENEAALGEAGKRTRRRKSYEQKLQTWLRRDYLRRLEIQAEMDVPGARDALAKYHQDIEKASTPTRAQRVWEYVTKRKLPPLSALADKSLRGEIADLELPRRVFDPAKTHGLDAVGQSLVDWLAENGDPDAAAMIERGEQFTESEVAAMIGDAFSDFREREARAARGQDEVPVPVIPMPEAEAASLPAVKAVPAGADVPAMVSEAMGQIQAVTAMDPGAFNTWAQSQEGGFSNTAQKVGRALRSRSEVNALVSGLEEARAQGQEITARVKAGDMAAMDQMMAAGFKEQFFREAYEAALGEGGTLKRLLTKDPAYQAPIVRNPDGTYTVRGAEGVPPATVASPEAAAMVEQAQKVETAQEAATRPPEPQPDNDSYPLPERVTALTKTETAALRALYGMDALPPPERERWEQVLGEAKRTGADGNTRELVADLLATGRAHTAVEAAAMRLQAAKLQNQHEQLQAQIAEAFRKGDTERAASLQRVDVGIVAELDQLTEADDRAGTSAARALAIRRMRISRDDYSIVRLVQRAQTAKRGALTPEERGRLQTLEGQLLEQQRVIERQKAELIAQATELAKAEAQTFVAEGRARRRQATARQSQIKRKELKRELLAMGVRVNDITSLVPMSFEYARIIAQMADTYIAEGVTSLAELTNKLKADVPDLSDQDIFMAVGRQTKKAAARIEDEAKRRVRELRSQAALWAKINAALQDRRPDGSPINRTQKNRVLRDTLAELRRQANRTTFNDAALKRIDAKIAEVQRQLSTGERSSLRPAEARAEPEALTQARETLKELRQEMGAVDTIAELERALAEAEPQPAAEGKPAERPDPTERQQRLNALRERIADLRDEIDRAQVDPAAVNAERLARLQRLGADLEAQLEGGFRRVSKARPGVPADAAVESARRQIGELERLMRTQDAIADLEEQLRTGRFKVSVQEKRVLANARLEQALIRQKQLRREADQIIEKLRPLSAAERVVETLLIPRTLLATADLSATFRQGLLLSARRPVTATRALVASIKAATNAETADAIALGLQRRPLWAEGDRAKLYLSDIDGAPNAREENFMSNFAERLPGLGSLVRASGRAMATHLNILRVAAFDGFVQAHPESTLEQRRAFAAYVNAASGRGNVKWSPSTVKTLNALFFAPRYAVSRFQALYSPFANFNDAPVRNEILKDFGAFLGTGATVLLLAQLAGAETSLDPTESDFGKIVIGDTRIDIWGGLQQPARLLLQAALLLPQKFEAVELEKDIDMLDASLRFVSYKLSPAVTVPLALAEGENIIGREQGAGETLVRAVIPLSIQEMYDVYDNTGDAAKTAGLGLATFFGIGVQEHGK